MRITTITALLALSSPANAFIDLGFVDIPGQNVGYEARIRQFNDPAQPIDYWLATNIALPGSFPHDFPPEYNLTLASSLGLALPSPATMGPIPAVPEPSTWAMLMLGFIGLAYMLRKRRPQGRFTMRVT